jgi:RimJ/RimL family protein N-acetyltransferase
MTMTHADDILDAITELRPFDASDADLIMAASLDPYITAITSIPWDCTSSQALEFVQRQQAHIDSGAALSLAIVALAPNRPVGGMALSLSAATQGRITLSYWVEAAFRRQGFATDALITATRFALAYNNVQRVDAYIEPVNEASWRAAENAGFVREGLMRRWQRFSDGTQRDAYVYSVVAD